jgi:phytoene desaturase
VLFHDGTSIDYGTSGPALWEQLERFETGATVAHQRLLAHTKTLYQRAFEELGTADFSSLWSMLAVVPDLARVRADQSVHALVSRYFEDPRLRILFSFHPLFIGGNPDRASSVNAIVPHLEQVGGVYHPMGGTFAMIQALIGLFERLGGKVELGNPVTEVIVSPPGRAMGVRTADGRGWPAEVVVSNADPPTTYRRLVSPEWRRTWSDARLDRLKLSMSCYVLYLGLNRQYPHLRHHTILMPSDFPGVLGDLFDRKVMLREPALYVHAPTRTEPGFAPPGGEVIHALAPVPHLDGRIDWEHHAPIMREQVVHQMETTLGMTGVRDAIVVERERTPVEFRDLLGSERGAAFSIEPVLLQSAWFRPHYRSEDVKGRYLAGAGTHPGAGISGTLLAGNIAANCALVDLGLPPSFLSGVTVTRQAGSRAMA